jgi:hypothetical protein
MIYGEVGSFRFGESGDRSQEIIFIYSPRLPNSSFIIHHSSFLTTRRKWFYRCGVPYLPLNKERIA